MCSKRQKLDSSQMCFTDLEVIESSFLWTINNFSLRTDKTGQFIESTLFWSPEDPQTKWCLRLYPNGRNEESKDFISCFLCLKESIKSQSKVKMKFELIYGNNTQSGESTNDKFDEHTYGKGWGYHKFITKSKLIDKKNRLVSNDKLTFYCEVRVYGQTKTMKGIDNPTKFVNKEFQRPLLKDITSLFESQKYADIDIVVNNKILRAHKAILSMRSSVFEKMFEHPMKESLNNELIIEDFNEDVFKEVLRFIYTDCVVFKDFNSGSQLLEAAEKYDLIDLKVKCEEYLISQLSTETVCEAFVLSDMYSSEGLKKFAINFINNNSKEVMKTQNWKKVLKRQDLLNQLI